MNEMTIRLDRNGAAAVPGGQLLLGYAGNRGNYRLRIEQRGEWKGLTVCAHWHTPGASAATLVENGILTVPACSFKAIKKLPIGFYGIMDMSRVIFATVLGITVLGEVMTGHKIAGMALVLVGLLFVNAKGKGLGEEKTKPIYIVLVLISCLCNAVSELLDKMLMQSMNSGQLQFWYMFFMVILYLGYMIVTKTKIDFRTIYKNYWILILSVLFVIGDKALFIACSKQESTVVAMTLIKQCSVMITIIGGRIVFKEKRTLYKMVCAAVIIAGIVFAVM